MSLAKLRAKARVDCARGPSRAIHVDRQAEHEAGRAALGGERQDALGVGGEIAARHGFDAGRQSAIGIADGDADGLGAEIEPDQAAAGGEMNGRVDQWQYDAHDNFP